MSSKTYTTMQDWKTNFKDLFDRIDEIDKVQRKLDIFLDIDFKEYFNVLLDTIEKFEESVISKFNDLISSLNKKLEDIQSSLTNHTFELGSISASLESAHVKLDVIEAAVIIKP